MNDGIGKEAPREGRLDKLAQSIFELREVCGKGRCLAKDIEGKLFGVSVDSSESKKIADGGLIGELTAIVNSARMDVTETIDFIQSLTS